MRDGWVETTLGEIASVERGYSYTSADLIENPIDTAQSCALFGLKAVGRNGGFREDGVRWLSAVPDARFVVNEGDLLVATTDLTRAREVLGSPILAPNFVASSSTVFSLDLIRLVVGQDVSSQEFLSEWLRWSRVREEVKALGTGTTVIHLNIKGFKRLKISVPPKPEQQRIVDLMRAVDEYITAADKHVETAKTARGALLADLLSNPGDDWRLLSLQDIGGGGLFTDGDWVESKDQDPDGDVRLTQLADIGDGLWLDKSSRYLTSTRAKTLKCTFLQENDILIARMPDPIGRACIFKSLGLPAVTVVDVAILRISQLQEFDPEFIVNSINLPRTRHLISALQGGTTRARVSRGNLARVPIPVPPLLQQRRIIDVLSSADGDIAAATKIAESARHTRAALLSDLLSGNHEIPASYDRFLEVA